MVSATAYRIAIYAVIHEMAWLESRLMELRSEDAPWGRLGRLERLSQMANLAVADPATRRQVRRFRQGMQQAMASVVMLLDALLPALTLERKP